MIRPRFAPALAFLGALLAVALATTIARAHAVGLSRGDYRLDGVDVAVELTFARAELAGLVPELDPGRSGTVQGADLDRERGRLESVVVGGVHLAADGAACPGALVSARLVEEDGVVVVARYGCPSAPSTLSAAFALADALAPGHRHLATMWAGQASASGILVRGKASLELVAGGSRSRWAWVRALFAMGVEHILTGYDHLLFLFGLILVGGRARALALTITAFTVAHSITLGAAALGLVAPSPRLVEPAIALSIAYVGVENWFSPDAAKRWRVTFAFGLVHGLGFAGALSQIKLPHADVPLALAAFNVGVEAGQLAVLALVLPIVLFARDAAWFRTRGVRALSTAIAGAGVVWFVARAFGIG